MGLLSALDIGPLDMANSLRYGIGGAESNVAIGVARLGQSATWLGRIGPDATGDMIERRLRAEGVITVAIRDPNPTGLMVRHQRFAHVAKIDYHRHHSAASNIGPSDVPRSLIEQARILHVTGITTALSHSAAAAVFESVAVARAAGVLVSVDINYRRRLWSPVAAAPTLHDLATKADILFAGPDEARLVLGPDAPNDDVGLARALAALGPAETIVKAGARGATAQIDGRLLRRDALVVPVIDVVGAGDAFVAGYLTERLKCGTGEQKVDTAIRAGALAVSVRGDCEGLPWENDLDFADMPLDVLR